MIYEEVETNSTSVVHQIDPFHVTTTTDCIISGNRRTAEAVANLPAQ